MKNLSETLGLFDRFTTEIVADKTEFLKSLISHIDEADTSFNPFEAFGRSDNEFLGRVRNNGFELRRRKRLFDTTMNWSLAKGTIEQKENIVVIETEITGFNGMAKVFFIVIPLIYLISFVAIIIAGFPLGIIALIFHACLMIGIPYLILKRGIKRMKRDLEREFFFLTKNHN